MYAGTHFTDPERMESLSELYGGKEGHTNIQPSTRPGIEPGTSGLGGRDLNHCANPSAMHLRNIYSFKFKAIFSFKEDIFTEHGCVRGHSRNIYSKIVPSHFMINISFTITIS